jgi:MoxR-like ATPase
MDIKERAEQFRKVFDEISNEIGKVIVGQKNLVRNVLICLFTGGHCLLEGVPGLGKTLLVRTLSQALDARFSRIQFTPDLMPSDITGTTVVQENESGRKVFEFQKGPVFSNILLADEINRATPKTQSALLEAMQEHHVTVSGTRHILQEPFFVLATQNPIEMEGTYPLPEAQLDRFFFKLMVDFPTGDELGEIINRTTKVDIPEASKVMSREQAVEWQTFVREIEVAPHVSDYAVRLVLATHPEKETSPDVAKKYLRYGSSPRGAQALILAGKVSALLDARYNVGFDDIKAAAPHALRHRIILNFEAEAEGIEPDYIINQLLDQVTRVAE